jgi:hypothetical protein
VVLLVALAVALEEEGVPKAAWRLLLVELVSSGATYNAMEEIRAAENKNTKQRKNSTECW